jgi:hypothetical protein
MGRGRSGEAIAGPPARERNWALVTARRSGLRNCDVGAAGQFSQSPSSGKQPSAARTVDSRSIRSAMLALSENFITADDDLETTVGRVTNAAVDLIDGIDYADVLLVLDGEFLSVAPADPFVADLDALQMQLEEGPCLPAVVDDAIVWCNDLQPDERWPAFSGPALAGGLRGVRSYQLYTNRGGSGALNLIASVLNRTQWTLTAK